MCDECHTTPARFRSQDGPTAADSERFSFGLDLSPEYLDAERKILSRDLCDSCLVTLSQAADERFKTVKNPWHFSESDAKPAADSLEMLRHPEPAKVENATASGPEMPQIAEAETGGNATDFTEKMPRIPKGKKAKNATDSGTSDKTGNMHGNQHVTDLVQGADFLEQLFRNEVYYSKTKVGYTVRIVKRLRWSEIDFTEAVASFPEVPLTPKNVTDLRDGKFYKPAIKALKEGGIHEQLIRELAGRPGHGRGRRRKDLNEHERATLLFIEQHASRVKESRGHKA